MFRLDELITIAEETKKEIGGKWVPARPRTWPDVSYRQRIKDAWEVFMRRADAVKWPGNQ